MKALSLAIVLVLAAVCVANAAVSIDANNMPAKDAFESIAKQCGAQVLMDAGVTGTVTASLKDITADQAMDVTSKAVGATWRKIQFATSADVSVPVEKIRAAVSALAALDVAGLSLTDATSGKTVVFAKGLGQDAVTNVKLPEGQTWKTYFLVSRPDAKPKPAAASAATTDGSDPLVSQRLAKIASMNPEERQQYIQSEFAGEMQLAPDTRAQLWKDRMTALRTMMQDPNMGEQLRGDLHEAFRGMRGNGGRGGRGGQQPPP